MTGAAQADWIALTLVAISAFLGPYAVVIVRRRLSHATPKQAYAPHLVFLCAVRFVPMLIKGVPSAGATALAFFEALTIWAVGVSLGEWYARRRLHRRA